jgi:small ligand-binding sensory domain FIST
MTVKTRHAPAGWDAASERLASRDAAREVAEHLRSKVLGRPDLLVVFASFHHRALLPEILDMLRADLHPAHLLATTAEATACGGLEFERGPSLSVLALRLPGLEAHPFSFDLADGPPSIWSTRFVRDRVALPVEGGPAPGTARHRATLLLADPFSIHAGQACARIDAAAGPEGARIHGGVASGASHPGLNVLAVDRRIASAGIVGLSLFGDFEVDALVSEGCAPLGEPLVVTRARDFTIQELGGVRALDAARRIAEAMPPERRDLLSRGLLVGVAPNAGKPRLGRGDYLVREVAAVDPDRGSITLSERVPVGATVCFHLRDPGTAHEDLELLLDRELLRGDPAAALLFTCNRRGTRLFGDGENDASTIARRLARVPLAGFHTAGELAPVAGRTHLHTLTAALAVFRAAPPAPTEP